MTDPTDAELWTTWHHASRDAAVDDAIRALYDDVGQAIHDAPRGLPHGPPTCNVSGRCCKFDSYGHRLYVTGLEIAWFLDRVSGLGSGVSDAPRDVADEPSSLALPVIEPGHVTTSNTDQTRDPAPHIRASLPDACRYQVDGRCSTHTLRPLGCRVYFCTPGTDDWQHAVYERFLDRLRALHAAHDLPYRYMEWRVGLVEGDRWLK
ncbi:hypothetical protein OT109_03210 [Phycisphaeraceae bacterium D3-23]